MGTDTRLGAIRRYPVKSMIGEELASVTVTERGLSGDRAAALIDEATGKVASAKNPKVWPGLLDYRASFVDAPATGGMPAIEITRPDGERFSTDDPSIDARLTASLGRGVRLARSAVAGALCEGYWPDHDWLPDRDQVFEFPLPAGTFFDGAPVHLVTTATLAELAMLAPSSRFDLRRFRPNLVVETPTDARGFVENAWVGRELAIGSVRLRIDGPCPRCVMTTLAQSELGKDPEVLRTAVRANAGNVGLYASVLVGGTIRVGDACAVV